MMILGLYLDKVWPSTYGVRRHPLYFLGWIKRIPPFSKWFAKKPVQTDDVEATEQMPDDVSKAYQDAHSDKFYAVRAWIPFCSDFLFASSFQLKVISMVKQYEKRAIDSFPLSLWRPLVRYKTFPLLAGS